MVQVVFRHGARTPLTPRYWDGVRWDECGEAYAKAPLTVVNGRTRRRMMVSIDAVRNNVQYPGGCMKGELTLLGQLQALQLGQWLRSRYIDGTGLLPRHYDQQLLSGRTTNYRRTRATLHGVLTGLYPLDTRGFTVESHDSIDEILVQDVSRCFKLAAWYDAAKAAAMHRNVTEAAIMEADQRVRRALRLPLDDERHRVSWSELHDALTSLAAHGKTLPPGLTPDVVQEINQQATHRMMALLVDARDTDVVRLGLGRLLAKVEEHFERGAGMHDAAAEACPLTAVSCASASEGAQRGVLTAGGSGDHGEARGRAGHEPRMLLWSGHDTTIMPVLVMLGQDVNEWPPYASNVVLELWEDQRPDMAQLPAAQRHYVRTLYNKRELTLPGAADGEPVTLAMFKEQVLATFALSPDAHARECRFAHESSLPVVDTSSY